jgi:hypothetical protein
MTHTYDDEQVAMNGIYPSTPEETPSPSLTASLRSSMNKLKLIRGKMRIFWGFCPKCNSDAPELYDCNVCSNYNNSYPFPPSKVTKGIWLHNYKIDLKSK